jgi:hypothetical protein
MSRSRKRIVSCVLAALVASVAAPAGAQKSAGARGEATRDARAPSAKQLYSSAQKLFDKGRYAEALVAFRLAHSASDSPNARLMIGHCLVALGKLAEAYEEMAATMREAAKRAESEPRYAPTRDTAATQLALLEPKVGKLIVEVQERAGAAVMINGEPIDPEKLGIPMAVNPGTAVIAATHADGRKVQREHVVKAGTTERVTLTFPEAPKAGGGPTAGASQGAKPAGGKAPDERGPGEERGGGVRTAGVVVAGLGVAGMAVFGVTGMMARSRFATLEQECGGERCTDPKYGDVIDSGRMLTTAANIGLIAGAAGIAGGGLMILLGGPSDASPKRAGAHGPAGGAALRVSPGGAALVYSATF